MPGVKVRARRLQCLECKSPSSELGDCNAWSESSSSFDLKPSLFGVASAAGNRRAGKNKSERTGTHIRI
jgi:hypothetical protein